MKVNFDGKNFDNHFFQFQFKKKKKTFLPGNKEQ